MKKFLLLTVSLFLVSTSIAKDYSTQEELKKIEDEVQKCIDTNFISDYTMAQCIISGTEKYNIEINKTVNAAKNYLSKSQYKRFLNQQKNWEKTARKYANKVESIAIPPYQPYLFAADDEYEHVKNRAIYLNKYIEGFLK